MKAIAFSIWLFINLVCFGMCGYIYLLWSQYWNYITKQQKLTAQETPKVDNRPLVDYFQEPVPVDMHDVEWRHQELVQLPLRSNSKPRFPNSVRPTEPPKPVPECYENCDFTDSRLLAFKNQLIVRLRRVLHDESNVFRSRDGNPYNVHYKGTRSSHLGTAQELLCDLMKAVPRLRTIDGKSRPFSETGLGDSVPRVPLFSPQEHFNNCAIVSSAGSLKGSNLGPLIDSNDVVLRFNHAPTEGYDDDVGTKTTIRILNSQVVSKPEFNFLYSPMYRDIKVLAWDPSNYTSSLEQWFMNPDFDIFTPYMKHRQMNPETNSHILDPRDLWKLWDYLQAHTPVRIRKNPPSSGFLGLVLLLPYCSYINMYEYIPTVRLTKMCHYFDEINDPSCTFGAWHPLSAEKLLALGLNRAPDRSVYQTGFITIPGYQNTSC